MSKHATSKSRAAKGASHDDAPGAKEAPGKMILQHGESNNWLTFKEWAIDHFGAKYGKKVRHILQHGKRVPETPYPPRPMDTRAMGGSLGGGGKSKAKPSKKASAGGGSSSATELLSEEELTATFAAEEYESAAEEDLDFETQLEIWKTAVATLTKLRTEHAEKDADIDTKVYSELMLLLSADSRDKVKSVKGFQTWHDAQDPVKLWHALQKTHECNVTGVQRIDETTAETNFITLKQGPESLVEYKVTFDQARRTLEHTSYGAVDEKRAAMRFLVSLDMNRFARLVCDVQNRAFHDAGSLPQTFEEAYVLATNYKDVRVEGASVTVGNAQSFYAGKVGGGGGGDRPKKKGKGSKGKGGKSEGDKPQDQGKHGKHGKQSDDRKDGKPKQGNSDKYAGAKDHGQAKQPNCHTCGADDHWAAKCPHKEAAQRAIAKAKAGGGEARSIFYANHQQQQPEASAYAGQQEPFDSRLERLIAGSFVIKATSSYGECEQQCFMARKSDVLMDCGSSVSIMADEVYVTTDELAAQERADATRKQVGAVSFSNRGGTLLDAATPVEAAPTPPRILERALGDAPTYVQTPQLQSGQATHRAITIEKAGVPLRAGERVANQGGVQAHVEMPQQANQRGVSAASAGGWQADLPAAPSPTNKAFAKPTAKPSKSLEPAPPSAVQSRVSGRTIKAPEWKSMVASTSMFDELACHEGGLNVFYTLNKALREGGAEAAAGEEATEKELRQLYQEAEAIIPIDASTLTREQRKTAMRGQLILKKKYKASGEFDKTKARFVANGSMQPGHLYEGQTSAPTAALSSQFAIISIAAGEKRKVRIYDIKGAYLQADMPDHPNGHPHYVILDRLVASRFVKIYPKFQNLVGEDGTLWMKIKKALYGCKQSGQLWYKLLTKTLANAGFVANRYDPCIMNKTCNGTQLTVIFHVDDLHVSSVSNELLDRFEKFLHRSFPEVTSRQGPILDYLGMVLDYSIEGECHVAMPGFMDELLEGVEGKAATPATDTLFKVREDAELLGPKEQAELHTIVAQLLYLTKHTRPDIMVPVAFLTTRVQKATVDDKAKLDRILKYLNGTREEGITLSMDPKNPSVRACIDAAYACHEDMQSHTGMTITLGKGPIFAKSTKQKLVSRSSTEAEQIALSDGAGLAIWINKLLQDQGYRMPAAIVYQDNKSTIHLANNGRSTSEKTRHIDVRYFWIKDRIDKGEVRIEYLPTAEMTADVLTKPITGALYQRLKDKLMHGH